MIIKEFWCSTLFFQVIMQIWVCLSCNSLHSVAPSFQVIVCSGSTMGIEVSHTWSKLPIHPGLVKMVSEPHTSVTVFAEVVCMYVCLRPYTINFKSIPWHTYKVGWDKSNGCTFLYEEAVPLKYCPHCSLPVRFSLAGQTHSGGESGMSGLLTSSIPVNQNCSYQLC